MNDNERRLLRADEVAREFAVTPRTVATWAKQGILPAVEVGGVRRWRRSDVDRVIASAPDPPARGPAPLPPDGLEWR